MDDLNPSVKRAVELCHRLDAIRDAMGTNETRAIDFLIRKVEGARSYEEMIKACDFFVNAWGRKIGHLEKQAGIGIAKGAE